jgi:hypothetical protein
MRWFDIYYDFYGGLHGKILLVICIYSLGIHTHIAALFLREINEKYETRCELVYCEEKMKFLLKIYNTRII